MYESQTYEAILARMLAKALESNPSIDSREGSLLWLGEAPAAVELQNLYIALDTILRETFADTASREYLLLRAAERGLSPYPASAAVLQVSVTPANLALAMGTRFSIGELNFFVSKDLGGGTYAITCETAGEAGNNYAGTVIPIEYVAGLEACTVTAVLIPGEDEEPTEEFRKRYIDSLNYQAFGGNVQDYTNKIKAIPGVGGVKIYRAWNGNIRPADFIPPDGTDTWIESLSGVSSDILTWLNAVYIAANDNLLTVGGTVKAVIIDSTFGVPSSTLIDTVQTAIDPTQNAGEGLGLAPIGHVVRIAGVAAQTLNIGFTLTYASGYSWAAVQSAVAAAINGYFLELSKSWEDAESSLIVRISQIEARILEINGIIDIADTTINGTAANLTLDDNAIPALGTITPA